LLKDKFILLDEWIEQENKTSFEEGSPLLKKCEFKILGQTALIEAKLNLSLTATVDVDAYTNAQNIVKAKLAEFLREDNLELDALSDEIWMPTETKYSEFYKGSFVNVFLADPVYILVSKALKAMQKNKLLILEYIASNPPKEFFRLCEKYKVDLKKVMK